MQVLFRAEKDVLTVFLSGDIDHHTSKKIREAIDDEMRKLMPSVLKLDFRDVHFMDSSGVGLVMGRYKNALIYGCSIVVSHLSSNAEKIMKMSGLEKIITFEKD